MTNVLIIQNTRTEGSGNLGDLLEFDGFTVDTIHAKKCLDAMMTAMNNPDYSLLVILGGPQSANDDLDYLQNEQKLIKQYTKQQKPVLGICLGSQLIAKAFGANVYRGAKTEIGFYNDIQLSRIPSDLFSGLDNPFMVFHWHADTFDLPCTATRLASSAVYPNQAFEIETAVGLQFHFEVNRNMINSWLDNAESKLSNIPYIDPEKIRCDIDTHISRVESNMSIFYKNFKHKFHL